MLCSDEENGSVRRMLSVCSEFERIAKVVLDKADKESSSRRKRRQQEDKQNDKEKETDKRKQKEVEKEMAAVMEVERKEKETGSGGLQQPLAPQQHSRTSSLQQQQQLQPAMPVSRNISPLPRNIPDVFPPPDFDSQVRASLHHTTPTTN